MLKAIAAELARNGMTKKKLADQLGVNRKTISKWIYEETNIPASAVVHMAEIFHCSSDYLLGLQDSQK